MLLIIAREKASKLLTVVYCLNFVSKHSSSLFSFFLSFFPSFLLSLFLPAAFFLSGFSVRHHNLLYQDNSYGHGWGEERLSELILLPKEMPLETEPSNQVKCLLPADAKQCLLLYSKYLCLCKRHKHFNSGLFSAYCQHLM